MWMKDQSQINSSYARWFATLQFFEQTIQHQKGTLIKYVDCLSRQPVAPAPEEDKYVNDTTMLIGAIEHEDPEKTKLEEIMQYLYRKQCWMSRVRLL